MASKMDKIKGIILNDKRLCERLTLPMEIRYARVPADLAQKPEWSEKVWLDNIGGEGLGFSVDDELGKGEMVDIELRLPCDPEPFVLIAEVVRMEKHAQADQGDRKGKFFYGVKICELQNGHRKKFEQFIADGIMDKYLDDQGHLKGAES